VRCSKKPWISWSANVLLRSVSMNPPVLFGLVQRHIYEPPYIAWVGEGPKPWISWSANVLLRNVSMNPPALGDEGSGDGIF
jgi:hypothetical protein